MKKDQGAGVVDAAQLLLNRLECVSVKWMVCLGLCLLFPTIAAANEESDLLVERGKAALFAAEYEAAARAFTEALAIDRADVRAIHGSGLAAYHQGKVVQARAALMRAMELAGDRADRALVLNLTALHIEMKEPLAGLKLCQAHLQRHAGEVDEPLLNAMGTALVAAMNRQPSPEIDTAANLYMKAVARLEQTRPGMKRWGTRWVTAAEFQRLSSQGVPEYPTLVELVELDAPIPGALGTVVAVTDGGIVERAHPDRANADRALPPRGDAGPAAGDHDAAAVRGDAAVRQALGIPIAPDLLLTPASCVEGVQEVTIQSAEGEMFDAAVVRLDAGRNLALLRVRGVRMHYLNLADAFDGGPVQCAAVTERNLFAISPTLVAGTTPSPRAVSGVWTVKLETSPTLAGAPLTSNGKVIGVALKSPGEQTEVPAIPLDQIRGFLGSDMPKAPSRFRLDARSSVYQVIASGGK